MKHIPVLLQEVITALKPHSEGLYIDATVGDGGHAAALLEASSPNGRLLGLDQDEAQIRIASERLKQYAGRFILVRARFSGIREVAYQHDFKAVDGILFDLGISSRQLATPTYGLSFEDDSPLDMRLSEGLPYRASDLLNHANEREIADVLYAYGDRHNSRTLAHRIIVYRKKIPFRVAHDLKEALSVWRPGDLAPIFQALRIWVNREYDELLQALPQVLDLLRPGGVLALITFHSGEDRIVKRFLQQHRELLEVNKIIKPTWQETQHNPRARSAKLRIAVRK